jgi:hypothetical protein
MHEFSGFHAFVSSFPQKIQLWYMPVQASAGQCTTSAQPVQHQCCTNVLDFFPRKHKLRADRWSEEIYDGATC